MKFKTIQDEKEMGKNLSLTADITAFIFKKTPSDKILQILRLFQSSGRNKIKSVILLHISNNLFKNVIF